MVRLQNKHGSSVTHNPQLIQRYIAQGPLRWFGHLLRFPPNHPAHAIYTFNLSANLQTDLQTDRQTDIHTDIQTDRQTDRQT